MKKDFYLYYIYLIFFVFTFTSCSHKYHTSKLDNALSLIQDEYINDVNTTDLIDNTLEHIVRKLDSHSTYLSRKDLEKFLISTHGQIGGIGISMHIENKLLTVISAINKTPAELAGIESGDIIIKINQTSTLGLTIEQCVALTRGSVGSYLNLTILREGKTNPIEFNIKRTYINTNPVTATLLESDLLYIRLSTFNDQTSLSLKNILKNHPHKKGIILDLRYNPGGKLNEAVAVADMFIEKGVIVSQKGRSAQYNTTYYATRNGTDSSTPMAVLINKGSASASEIVSGALKYYKRALLIGEKSFGKGTVQTLFALDNYSALKMTIAKYYLPNGKCIDTIGIIPDYPIKNKVYKQYKKKNITYLDAKKIIQKLENRTIKVNKLSKKDSLSAKKSHLTPKNIRQDKQLNFAITLLKNNN